LSALRARIGTFQGTVSLYAKNLDTGVAVRASVRSVVEHVTLADLASGNIPDEIRRMGDDPDARIRR